MDSKHPERDPRGTIPKRKLDELYGRLAHGQKQQFISAMGVSPNTVRSWINGRHYMGDAQVVKAAALLGVSAFDLLDYEVKRSEVDQRPERARAYSHSKADGVEWRVPINPPGMFGLTFRELDLHPLACATWEYINNESNLVIEVGEGVARIVVIPCIFDPLEVFGNRLPFTYEEGLVEERDGSCYYEKLPVYPGSGFEQRSKDFTGMGGLRPVYPCRLAAGFATEWETTDPQGVAALAGITVEEYRQAAREAFWRVPTDFRDLAGVARAVGEVGAELDPVGFILGAEPVLKPSQEDAQ